MYGVSTQPQHSVCTLPSLGPLSHLGSGLRGRGRGRGGGGGRGRGRGGVRGRGRGTDKGRVTTDLLTY